MRTCIIGGSLLKLTAAQSLSNTPEATVFESWPFLGRYLAPHAKEDHWTEQYYHHCFADNAPLSTPGLYSAEMFSSPNHPERSMEGTHG